MDRRGRDWSRRRETHTHKGEREGRERTPLWVQQERAEEQRNLEIHRTAMRGRGTPRTSRRWVQITGPWAPRRSSVQTQRDEVNREERRQASQSPTALDRVAQWEARSTVSVSTERTAGAAACPSTTPYDGSGSEPYTGNLMYGKPQDQDERRVVSADPGPPSHWEMYSPASADLGPPSHWEMYTPAWRGGLRSFMRAAGRQDFISGRTVEPPPAGGPLLPFSEWRDRTRAPWRLHWIPVLVHQAEHPTTTPRIQEVSSTLPEDEMTNPSGWW